MFARLPMRRAIAASVVILFHLLLLYALVKITELPVGIPTLHENPLEIFFPSFIRKPEDKEKHKPTPPVPITRPIYIPYQSRSAPAVPPLVEQQKQQNQNGIRALGRYLYNCSSMYYEELSEREWQHCLANQWDLPDVAKSKPPVLPKAAPSPFDIVIKERRKKSVPIEHQCKPGQMLSNLGLPCYDFSGQ
jgi:hypothetical protein